MSNQVPEGWEAKKLDDCISYSLGGGTPSRADPSYWVDGSIPWMTVKDLATRIVCDTQEHITAKGLVHSTSHLVPKNTLIISTRMAVGKCVRSPKAVAINQDLKALFLKPDVSADFFHFYLDYIVPRIERLSIGSTVKGIQQKQLFAISVTIPKSLTEQKRIAAILQSIDNDIDKTRELVEKYKKMKQGLMQDLLDKRKSILGADGKPIEKWELTTLGNLVTRHDAGVYKKADLYGSGRNIVGVSDLYYNESIDGQIFRLVRLSPEEADSYTLKEGDLIYGESSLVLEGIARTLYVTPRGEGTAFAWHTRRIRVNRKKVDPQFLHYLLNHETVRRQIMSVATQTALTGITTADFFNIKLSLPDLPEQVYIRDRVKSIIDMIQAGQSYLDKLIKMKAGLMQDLLTGKVRVAA
jgi:type I restriction enzyme S subunit